MAQTVNMEAQSPPRNPAVPLPAPVPAPVPVESGREKSDDELAAQQGEIVQVEAQQVPTKEGATGPEGRAAEGVRDARWRKVEGKSGKEKALRKDEGGGGGGGGGGGWIPSAERSKRGQRPRQALGGLGGTRHRTGRHSGDR